MKKLTRSLALATLGSCAILVAPQAAMAADAQARSWREFPGVANTSFVEPGGDRAIQLSIEVPAPVRDVYAAYATTEGFSSWAVPVTQVELRIGGVMESSYDATAKIGDRNNIRNQILAYVPERLLVIRNIQAPPALPDAELFQRTVTIIEFAATDATHTRVTMTNAGYGTGPGFDRLYRNFEWGDAYSLAELRKRFERGPVDWKAQAAQEQAKSAAGAVTRQHKAAPPPK
jgi:uncharacterized protein YndB with AHSA1/START domain